ncbi:hypothetical protein CLAFUR4_12304 [Fulvia fulva]|nr:hypothetical protein CLAFUR4_12304 [Fulvia fulva]
MSNNNFTFFDQFDFTKGFAAPDLMAGFAQDDQNQYIDPALLQLDAQSGDGAGQVSASVGVNPQPALDDVDWDNLLRDFPSHDDEGTQAIAVLPEKPPSESVQHHTIPPGSSHSPHFGLQVDRSQFDHDLTSQSFQRTAASARSQVQNLSPNMHHIPNLGRAPEGHYSPPSWSNQVPASLRTPQMQQTFMTGHNMTQNNPYSSPVHSIEAEHQQYASHQQRFTQRPIHGQYSQVQQGYVVRDVEQDSPGIIHQYSPGPEASPDPEYSDAGSRRPKGKGRARDGSTPHENPRCLDCGKRYRLTKSEGRCSRCADKHIRRLAGQQPHTYVLDPSVPDIATARQIVSPLIPGRNLCNDDYHRFAGQENLWVERLLQAVNVVQSEANDGSVWALRQQTYLNEKAELEKGYTDQQVTARLRALYQEIVNYHAGGPAMYAIGGDNAGYTDNRILTFSKRINMICGIMANNKRVVMDVVEGRGVQGLVANPEVYNRRKQSNNNCNEEKKRIMEKGKEVEGVTPGPKTRKRRRTAASMEPDVDGYEPVETEHAQAAPSDGLRRSPRLAEQLENALADIDGVEREGLGDDEYIPLQGYSAVNGGYR